MNKVITALFIPFSFFGLSQNISSNICSEIMDPTITNPANQASLSSRVVVVEGASTSQTTVTVLVDGAEKISVTADSANTYSGSVSVPEGQHTISVTAKSSCQTKTGASITVTGMPEPVSPPVTPPTPTPTPTLPKPPTPTPPKPRRVTTGTSGQVQTEPLDTTPQVVVTETADRWLSVEAPSESSIAGATRIVLSGKMSSAGTVVITRNGSVVAQTYELSTDYSLSVPVSEGYNKFTVTATIDGEQVTREIEVYVAPKAATTRTTETTNEGMNIWPYIIGGALTLLIIGSAWWFLAARRRKNKEGASYNNTMPPFGGGV